jgi:hypothetical protein
VVQKIDAIVAPTEAARKISNGHDFKRGDAEMFSVRQGAPFAAIQVPSGVKVPMCIS